MKERNPYCLLAFAIVLIWALWNYNVSLKLLADIYDVLLPFVISAEFLSRAWYHVSSVQCVCF